MKGASSGTITGVLRNKARCEVRSRARRRKRGSVVESYISADQAIAAAHDLRDWGSTILSFGVELGAYRIGRNLTKKNLNLKSELLALLLNGRGTESQRGPVFCQISLPRDQIGCE